MSPDTLKAPVADVAKASPRKRALPVLALTALGVVYGDIGTSPLYAFKVALAAGVKSGLGPGHAAAGIASLIIWSLVVIVSIKYALLILRADNRAEGGVVAMLALLGVTSGSPNRRGTVLLVLGLGDPVSAHPHRHASFGCGLVGSQKS